MRTPPHVAGPFLLAVFLAGCATLFQAAAGPSPERIAERGLAALEAGDFEAGLADLDWVSTNFPDLAVGRYALLALAAAELDPANAARQPDTGMERLADFRALPDNPPWTMPLANALRGLVLELRDTQERALMAEEALDRAARTAHEATERARVASLESSRAEAQRVSLGNRVRELERELAESQRQLALVRGEVERMRRTLGN